MIKELRKKFILVNMLLISMVIIIVFTALCVSNYRQIKQEGNTALQMALNRRGDQRPPMFEIGKQPPSGFNRSPVFMLSVDQTGEIRLRFTDNINVSEAEAAQIAEAALSAGGSEGLLRAYNLRFVKREEHGEIRIAFLEMSGEQTSFRNTVFTSVSLVLIAVAAFFLISLFLSKWALRPVEKAWRQQRQFVSDASHELKTPLTVILANAGILKSNKSDTVEQQMNWVENTEAEARRMKKLVDNLLFLAKTDEAKTPALRDVINLSDLVCSSALAFESVAFERDVTINADGITRGISVPADEAQLKQLVSILLDNAVKYSAPKGAVTVALKARQGKAILSVHNVGNPLSPEEISHLFERFYRADGSRTNEGYGLGLSIAKNIVDIHQGKLSVESSPADGTIFTAVLPV